MPIAVVPTMVGAATLSNMYLPLGFIWIRHITMIAATAVLVVYLIKIVCHFNTVKAEYSNTIPASIYAGIPNVASIKMSGFLMNEGNNGLGTIVKELSGIQIYITAAVIGFILYNLGKMLVE